MYVFAILLFSVFALIEVFNKDITEKNKIVFAATCFLFLVLHDGLRWETGSDWDSYYNQFNLIKSLDFEEIPFEPGFTLLFGGIKLLTDDYSVYLVLHALLFYSAFFFAIFKLSDFPFTSLLIFYMITVPFMGMNRQFLAMAVYIIALYYLISYNQKWVYFLLILSALLFHRTAILTLPILLLTFNFQKKTIVIGLIVCFLISASGILNSISFAASLVLGSDDQTGKKLDYYVNEDKDLSILSTVLSLVKKIIWLSLILVFEHLIDNKDRKFYILRNIYAFSIMIYILFNGTALQIIVARGLLYYNIAEIFMIPYVLTIFRQNYGKLLVMLVLIAYCFVNIYKGFSNYGEETDYFVPYKGLFINTDYVRQNTD